jgi:hypothetical protein
MVEGAVLAAQWQPQTLLGQGIMCVQASQLASLPPALQTGLGWAEDPAGTASDSLPKKPICWLTLLGQGILCVQASWLTSLPPAYQSDQLSRKARVDSPKSVRNHSKKLTSVSIHLKKCVLICWLILCGQGNLCVQASRLASLPPAHQSGQPSGKAKCYYSLTKK